MIASRCGYIELLKHCHLLVRLIGSYRRRPLRRSPRRTHRFIRNITTTTRLALNNTSSNWKTTIALNTPVSCLLLLVNRLHRSSRFGRPYPQGSSAMYQKKTPDRLKRSGGPGRCPRRLLRSVQQRQDVNADHDVQYRVCATRQADRPSEGIALGIADLVFDLATRQIC